MDILGYADQLSVRPGDRIRFMVSTERPRYRAEIIRLGHAYSTPKPSGFTAPVVPTIIDGEYPGRLQPLHPGSYALVTDAPPLRLERGVTIQAWIYPTIPADGRVQGIVAKRTAEGGGFSLILDEDGRLALDVGGNRLAAERPMPARQWYFVAASYDGGSGAARLVYEPLPRLWVRAPGERREESLAANRLQATTAPLLIAASHQVLDETARPYATGLYNGKIDRPRVWNRALSASELAALREGTEPTIIPGLAAGWEFAGDWASDTVRDVGAGRCTGRLINKPARAMTGHNWTGSDVTFHAVPDQYGAIHFHDDDLDDSGWEADFTLSVPDGLPSGLYAARLTAEGAEEFIPFYVRPPLSRPNAPIAFLAPTNTYLAYANERLYVGHDYSGIVALEIKLAAEDEFLHQHPELGLSLYDVHRDGSGVCYSSRWRPIVNMRPKYRTWINAGPRHFAADLHLLEWLETKRFRYDVITDEDLHRDGEALLASYKTILTGSHPEYWTTPMMDALQSYLTGGGRLMYLGGNGFYWVTAMEAAHPQTIEVRRGFAGTRCWESAPGETYVGLTGEPGGLWRYRGRGPHRLTGVGFAAQGWGGAEGYSRLPGSRDPRVGFIFDGIGADEVIGDFGVVMGGAAGDEVDRADPDLGTPPETIVMATSQGKHTNYYQLTIEDAPMMLPGMGGADNPKVRADLTYTEMPNGGAVFSVGSINWCGSLPTNGHENNVSRVTENVLRRFMS